MGKYWSNAEVSNANVEKIEQQLKYLINASDIWSNEYKEYWETHVENKLHSMPQGILKDGATKSLNALEEDYEQESNFNAKKEQYAKTFSKIIFKYLNKNDEELHSLEGKRLFSAFMKMNLQNGRIPASFDCIEQVAVEIIKYLLSTNVFLDKQISGRFIADSKKRNSRILALEKASEVALQMNNHALYNECKDMKALILKEDFITQEIIMKNSFWFIHTSLTDEIHYFNGEKPLPKDYKETIDGGATGFTNTLIKDFLGNKYGFRPSGNIRKKYFFEHGLEEPRVFHYYG